MKNSNAFQVTVINWSFKDKVELALSSYWLKIQELLKIGRYKVYALDSNNPIQSLSVYRVSWCPEEVSFTAFFTMTDSKGRTFDGAMEIGHRHKVMPDETPLLKIKENPIFASKVVVLSEDTLVTMTDLLNQDYDRIYQMMIGDL